MCLLFETIRVSDGEIQNPDFHNARFNMSRKNCLGIPAKINLLDSITVPPEYREGIYKCKVVYGSEIENVTFTKYVSRTIKSLQLVADNQIVYSFKYLNREHLDLLFQKRGKSDEILIVKNGIITDTSFSNILFQSGNQWITPANPLLPGTMRAYLLSKRLITEQEVHITDLKHFSFARIINAMLPFETGIDIPIENINLYLNNK